MILQDDVDKGIELLEEYLIEHASATSFVKDTGDQIEMFMGFGDPDRVPEFPEMTGCGLCGTAIAKIKDAGWRHLRGFQERGGCVDPLPT